MAETIKAINAKFGLCVFKPGYPTARRQYMILDGERQAVLSALAAAGITASRTPCGHDYNYGGDLYDLRRA